MTSAEGNNGDRSTPAVTDCVVVGGGLIGLFTAHALKRRNLSVAVVDRGGLGGGASRGNAGEIVPALVTPLAAPGKVSEGLRMFFRPDSAFYVHPAMTPNVMAFLTSFARHCRPDTYAQGVQVLQELAKDTFDLYTRLEAELSAGGRDLELNREGFLYIYRSEAAALAAREKFAAHGLDVDQVLGLEELLAVEANLGPRAVAGFVARPLWSLDPSRLIDVLGIHLADIGVQFYQNDEVVDVVSEGGTVEVVTSGGKRYFGRRAVIAAGVWSRTLCRSLGVGVPLVSGKGYSFEVSVRHPLNRVIQFDDAHVVATPITNGVRIAGTMEFDRTIDEFRSERVTSIVRAVDGYLADVDWSRRFNEWVGPRPMTGSGLPTIGTVPGADNVVVATGHNMHGLSLGPVTGRLVADLVCGDTTRTLFPVKRTLGTRTRSGIAGLSWRSS